MIRIENIYKSFGENDVLKGISVEFDEGQCNLIIGSSGSGKTVLMKCMVGLFDVDRGEILYDGRNFSQMSEKEKKSIRMEFGMLFQGNALFDSMTIEQNVSFPLNMFTNYTRKEKLNRVNEVLERVNLSGVNKQFPAEISGGMKKRVGIARAIVLQPKYLFCDEPNSGLDPKTSLVIDELLREITEEYNIVTVINTHDMNSVLNIGDKVIFLHRGNKHWEGNKSEILDTENEELYNFIFASDFLKELKKQ